MTTNQKLFKEADIENEMINMGMATCAWFFKQCEGFIHNTKTEVEHWAEWSANMEPGDERKKLYADYVGTVMKAIIDELLSGDLDYDNIKKNPENFAELMTKFICEEMNRE